MVWRDIWNVFERFFDSAIKIECIYMYASLKTHVSTAKILNDELWVVGI